MSLIGDMGKRAEISRRPRLQSLESQFDECLSVKHLLALVTAFVHTEQKMTLRWILGARVFETLSYRRCFLPTSSVFFLLFK